MIYNDYKYLEYAFKYIGSSFDEFMDEGVDTESKIRSFIKSKIREKFRNKKNFSEREYDDAINYLRDNDYKFAGSMMAASEMGFGLKDMNSVVLATCLIGWNLQNFLIENIDLVKKSIRQY